MAEAILRDPVVLEEEDWEHVSDSGKALVNGLLAKDPLKRMNLDDILKHSWVFKSKHHGLSSKKANLSFRQTFMRRSVRRTSMGAFEETSSRMNRLYRSRDDSIVLCPFLSLFIRVRIK